MSSAPAGALPLDPYDGGAPVAPGGPTLVEDSLWRVVWRVGAPAVASNLLMILFLAVDAFWVGRRLGATALAAVTTSLFWIWLFIAIAEMVGVGLTAVASRRHGEGRPADAARAVGHALVYSLVLGVVIAVVGNRCLPLIFASMRAAPDVTAVGFRYLGIYFLGAPGIFGYFVIDAAFRASGDTRTPLMLLGISVAITLVLDPVLILGLLGAPALGITGAALATIGVRGTAFVLGLGLLVRRRMVRIERAGFVAAVGMITRIGLPLAVTGVLFSSIYIVVARIAAQFGTPALAAMGLGFRIESWNYVVGVGFGAAAAAIVGQNLGARRPDRATRAGWITLAFAAVPALVAVIAELAWPVGLATVFVHDATVVAETARYLRIVALSQLFVGAELVFEGAMGGAGDTVPPMLWSTSCTISRVPLAAWAAPRFGTSGIWTVIAITAAMRGLGMMGLWHWGRWKRRSV